MLVLIRSYVPLILLAQWNLENNVFFRCIYINGDQHKCKEDTKIYQGSGFTTVGAWWNENYDNSLLLDNIIIISGIVQYNTVTNDEKQICFAQTLDDKLP